MDLSDRFNAAAFFVDRHLAEGRERTVFRFGGRSVRYGELVADVDRFGNALGSLGVEIENRVSTSPAAPTTC
jgi:acyl-coenzyme A synthetase/AMP-(fatty) acid ligase